ncbi:unnamed protein product [Alopecurus aequalis]
MARARRLLEAAEEEAPAHGELRPLSLPAVAVDPTGFGNEIEEPVVDYLLTVEYKPFNRQEQGCLSNEQYKKYIEAADFFDELRLMLAESQRQLREEHGYVVHN